MCLTGLESLSTWKAAQNGLSSIGPNANFADKSACAMSHLYTITSLDLSGNVLCEIPQPMRALTAIKELVLKGNRFVDLSPLQDTIKFWESLTRLDASGNRLHTMPTFMGSLKVLEIIDLSFNMFDKMPSGVCTIPNLKRLDLHKNFLRSIEAEIGMLTNLEELDVSENNLHLIAAEIRALTNIVSLNLSKNELEYLPPTIGMALEIFGELCNMKTLDVSNNRLIFLPLDISKCSSLTDLHVYGNMLNHPAMLRAQTSCFGSLTLCMEEVAGITYFNHMNQKARKFGNPMCTIWCVPF